MNSKHSNNKICSFFTGCVHECICVATKANVKSGANKYLYLTRIRICPNTILIIQIIWFIERLINIQCLDVWALLSSLCDITFRPYPPAQKPALTQCLVFFIFRTGPASGPGEPCSFSPDVPMATNWPGICYSYIGSDIKAIGSTVLLNHSLADRGLTSPAQVGSKKSKNTPNELFSGFMDLPRQWKYKSQAR